MTDVVLFGGGAIGCASALEAAELEQLVAAVDWQRRAGLAVRPAQEAS